MVVAIPRFAPPTAIRVAAFAIVVMASPFPFSPFGFGTRHRSVGHDSLRF